MQDAYGEVGVEVERPDGSVVTDFRSAPEFRFTLQMSEDELVGGEPVDLDSLLDERHRRFYGGPWILGVYYFDQLMARGLKPTDHVLDVGCGVGRVGAQVIPYLEADRYCGFDSHLWSLVAFARYETVIHRLAAKRPRLLLTSTFQVAPFGRRFDAVFDFSVTRGLQMDQVRLAYRNIAACMNEGGRVFLSAESKLPVAEMEALGFRHSFAGEAHYPLFALSKKWPRPTSAWHEFTRVGS